jgi:hypothetical protein
VAGRRDAGDAPPGPPLLYDGLLSAGVSFDAAATTDADAFVRDRVMPRFHEAPEALEGADPLVVIATDGELYGHHQVGRDRFLARLVGATAPVDRPFERPALGEAVVVAAARGLPLADLRERTSWSCHHGVVRWAAGCGCVADGGWKAPLRIALERLAGGIDAASETLLHGVPGAPDPWLARDAYVEVVIGATTAERFTTDVLGAGATAEARTTLVTVMEAQRLRLSMFASCGWFWESPDRPETVTAIRIATAAARRIDALAGTDLAGRLAADLRLVVPH